MRRERRACTGLHRKRGRTLRTLLAGALVTTALGALVASTTPRIVTAPTSAAGEAAHDSPAIAERLDGGFDSLVLPPDPHVASPERVLSGAGGARAIHVAVALVNFSDEPAEPFTASNVAETMFAESESLAGLYDEQSFGLAQVTGDVYGWLTIPRGASSCDFSGWADAATAAIGATTLSAYTNLLVVFPSTTACEWSGLAYVGGGTAWINGEPSVRATAHELGHNLGLGHASSLACTSAAGAVALGGECSKADEYGDPFTLRGSGGTLHMNGIHKLQLGWLSPANIADVERSDTFTLAPLGSATGQTQILRIGRGDSTLVIEYRQPVAAFERFGGPFQPSGGVTARIAEGPASAPVSLLVDSTPSTDTYADAFIAVGRELRDELTGVRVTTRSASAQSAEVEVVVSEPGPPGKATEIVRPATLVAVTTSGERRARVDLSWLPGAGQTSSGVQHYLVIRNKRVIARPTKPRLRRLEKHGRHVYRVIAVAADGARSAPSPALVVAARPPGARALERSALRGIKARPKSDGRLGVSPSKVVPSGSPWRLGGVEATSAKEGSG